MHIEFSDHAKQQLKRRKISQQLVKNVIQNPEEKVSSYRERRLLKKRIGGKLLEVVIKREGFKIIVITAYYLEE